MTSAAGPLPPRGRTLLRLLVFVSLYILLSCARSVQPNPLLPGAVIAIPMIVPVAAGMIEGSFCGLVTGVLGALVTAAVLALGGGGWDAGEEGRVAAELLSALPHGLMGLAAGWLEPRLPPPLPACTLIFGHLLKLAVFLAAGRILLGSLEDFSFWAALGWESFIGIALVTATVGIYRLGFERSETPWN